jgi:hypothetical protein
MARSCNGILKKRQFSKSNHSLCIKTNLGRNVVCGCSPRIIGDERLHGSQRSEMLEAIESIIRKGQVVE